MIIYQVVAEPRKDQVKFGRAIVVEVSANTPEEALEKAPFILPPLQNGKIEVGNDR